MEIKAQKFGVEIEMTGLTREAAARVAAAHFGAEVGYTGGGYDEYFVLDEQGRKWKFVSDSSINGEVRNGSGRSPTNDRNYRVEFVTPICDYGDIRTIQQLVRDLRSAGAVSNDSCGIHIHVDASPFGANELRNIVNIMAAKEDLIYKTLKVDVARENHFCGKTDTRWLEEINSQRPRTLDEIRRIWYRGDVYKSSNHYDSSRYKGLNLHSVFNKGTIEFRLFNSEIRHAGKIRAYITLCLAITAQALNQSCASRQKTQSTNEKYTFRTWLLRLGLIGDEFKAVRQHLLENLDGCIAWKDPAQALERRERLRRDRELEPPEEAPVFTMSM